MKHLNKYITEKLNKSRVDKRDMLDKYKGTLSVQSLVWRKNYNEENKYFTNPKFDVVHMFKPYPPLQKVTWNNWKKRIHYADVTIMNNHVGADGAMGVTFDKDFFIDGEDFWDDGFAVYMDAKHPDYAGPSEKTVVDTFGYFIDLKNIYGNKFVNDLKCQEFFMNVNDIDRDDLIRLLKEILKLRYQVTLHHGKHNYPLTLEDVSDTVTSVPIDFTIDIEFTVYLTSDVK